MSPTTKTPLDKPVYLIKGDPSLVSKAMTELRQALVGDADPSFAVEDLGGDELTVGTILAACQTPPFLVDRKVVVVRDIGALGLDDLDPLYDYLADPMPSTALILANPNSRSPKLGNLVKKVGVVIDASPGATDKTRRPWLVERLATAPVKFDAKVGDLLLAHLGEDVARVDGIIKTLTELHGEGARITADDLEPFLGGAGGVAPWDLTDAIDKGDPATAIDALHRMMKGGDRHPLAIMVTLHKHYASMLRLEGTGARSDAEAATILGGSPFPAGKALKGVRRLGLAGVARAIALLAAADLDLKGDAELDVDGEPKGLLLMEVLVARLARLGGTNTAYATNRRAGAGAGR